MAGCTTLALISNMNFLSAVLNRWINKRLKRDKCLPQCFSDRENFSLVLFDNSFHFSLGQLLCLCLLPVAKVTKTMLKIVIRVPMRCNTCISFHS